MVQFKDYIITNAGMNLVRSVLEKNTTLTLNVARLSDDPSLLTMNDDTIRQLTELPQKSNTMDFVTRLSESQDGQIEVDTVITNIDTKQDYQFTGLGLICQQNGQVDVLFAVAPATTVAVLSAFNGNNQYNLDLTVKIGLDHVNPTITFNESGYLTPADGQQLLNAADKYADSGLANKVDNVDTEQWQKQAIFKQGSYFYAENSGDFFTFIKSDKVPVGLSIIRQSSYQYDIAGQDLGYLDVIVLKEGIGWVYCQSISSSNGMGEVPISGAVYTDSNQDQHWTGWRQTITTDLNQNIGDVSNPAVVTAINDIYLSKTKEWIASNLQRLNQGNAMYWGDLGDGAGQDLNSFGNRSGIWEFGSQHLHFANWPDYLTDQPRWGIITQSYYAGMIIQDIYTNVNEQFRRISSGWPAGWASWHIIHVDTGWQALQSVNGFTTCSYRQVNSVIYLQGYIMLPKDINVTTDANLFPHELGPGYDGTDIYRETVATNGNHVTFKIRKNGIQVIKGRALDTFSLGGISWPI